MLYIFWGLKKSSCLWPQTHFCCKPPIWTIVSDLHFHLPVLILSLYWDIVVNMCILTRHDRIWTAEGARSFGSGNGWGCDHQLRLWVISQYHVVLCIPHAVTHSPPGKEHVGQPLSMSTVFGKHLACLSPSERWDHLSSVSKAGWKWYVVVRPFKLYEWWWIGRSTKTFQLLFQLITKHQLAYTKGVHRYTSSNVIFGWQIQLLMYKWGTKKHMNAFYFNLFIL